MWYHREGLPRPGAGSVIHHALALRVADRGSGGVRSRPCPEEPVEEPIGDVTRLLGAFGAGDRRAGDLLLAAVYDELKRLAAIHLSGERPGHTLQPTALVHEAYLKLVGQRVEWRQRAHFLGVAAQAMRRILVDHARRRRALRRGGGVELTVQSPAARAPGDPVDLLGLDDALRALALENERQAKVVELRYFAGLSGKEIAELLGVSEITVKRDWRHARAWLYRALEGEGTTEAEGLA